jgi:hypothetical protein
MHLVSLREVPDRFAVAFSLAGEQRELVLPVAQEVEVVLGRSTVFLDTWYPHLIAGIDGDLFLQKLYGTQTELVVVCISGDYGDKPWTRIEHRAVRQRIMQAGNLDDRIRILPLRVGDGDVPGVLLSEIVPDIRGLTPTQSAEIIVERLGLARRPVDDSAPTTRWPTRVPTLQWPMADHGEAREAFATLLSENSSERILLVRGASETGKTHMSNQMVQNAMTLPGVIAGRFDFKGSTDFDLEIEAFSQLLGIEPPAGHNLTERLARILTELRGRVRPTLLVFDTYEKSGPAKDWIEAVLLPHLMSARWLRVVVIGQSVPNRVGSIWSSIARGALTLQVPGPEHWLEYGRVHRDVNLKLDLVTDLHRLAEGKAFVLNTLLGPRS